MYDRRIDRAQDRDGLERLLRYCARPTLALKRLELLGAERVVYRLPEPKRDGTPALTPSPLELIDQLAAACSQVGLHPCGIAIATMGCPRPTRRCVRLPSPSVVRWRSASD